MELSLMAPEWLAEWVNIKNFQKLFDIF